MEIGPDRQFKTVRDWLRYAVSRFRAADLSYGHGTTNAVDEAAYLILHTLHLPIDQLEPWLDAQLLPSERRALAKVIETRISTRKPASYLTNEAWIQGHSFYVDERVIVPRSYIGELLAGRLAEIVRDPDAIGHALDLCTGSGCLAILAAIAFPNASIDASDVSASALDVARRNVLDYGLEQRIKLLQSDLFAALSGRRYDLVLANPPYVREDVVAAFPPEHAAEPRLAHAGGVDGLECVRRILAVAADHLSAAGILVVEVGSGRARLERQFPRLPFLWLDTANSEGEVFALTAAELAAST
ncbi:MAG TPA: 50S ribosomal protein L3 N(5)-glutamine methyltransferase [Hyphomicrobiaceae bacterium]|nr:50S ribosomal protein L3 N(5)-glutamine methyltransferase [Hyphomicrobiaceae bacterium]